ncbi:hypothetical protein O0235_09245 [Tepidiforma flava]|uniref:Uncharacterized protein n=1 Tax=Tepidiforma flava TaxID=3004094 RepID=A0ABY7M4S8_9CHLR|nr:hypothetical protein [Tepidiforma flava]WBL34978.1 hypothetical protein O0235_09245 [Tepidiforma flava]
MAELALYLYWTAVVTAPIAALLYWAYLASASLAVPPRWRPRRPPGPMSVSVPAAGPNAGLGRLATTFTVLTTVFLAG